MIRVYRANMNECLVTEAEAEKVTDTFVWVKYPIAVMRKRRVGDDYCYFTSEKEAYDYLIRDKESRRAVLLLSLKRVNTELSQLKEIAKEKVGEQI